MKILNNNQPNVSNVDVVEEITNQEQFPKILFYKITVCLGLAFFWIIFLWGFWNKGVYALGFNALVFLSLVILFFLQLLAKNGKYKKSDWSWLIPIIFLVISFFLYDNPFFKLTALFVLPWLLAIFYNYATLNNKTVKYWNFIFIKKILGRVFSFFPFLIKSFEHYVNLIIPKNNSYKNKLIKIIVGLFLLFIIAFTVVIPLLSSADPVFAEKMQAVMQWFNNLISRTVLLKIIVFIILSVGLLSLALAWNRELDYTEPEQPPAKVDSIISGIVLGGILLLYLLFLWIQFKRLWVGSLPFEFKETESLVKSGFWQLLTLSFINITIYFFTYKKIVPLIHKILTVFTVTSLLLLGSAGYRMALYVIYYGFSYEKFYATYTVLFCAILFVWLISRLFISRKSNIVKFLLFLFLWMYAVISIFPVEQFIVRENTALVKLKNSQIRLYEMSMLSPDVLSLIKKYQASGLLNERDGVIYRENINNQSANSGPQPEKFDWAPWIKEQQDLIAKKLWYELNLSNILYN